MADEGARMAQDRFVESRPAGDGAPVDTVGDGAAVESAGDGAPVDTAVIEQLATITDGEGFSVLGELLNAFLTAAPTRLDALDRAVGGRDLGAVASEAHALTGSSASFGARRMAVLCRQLRAAAEAQDLEATRPVLRSLHAEFGRVRACLVELTRRAS